VSPTIAKKNNYSEALLQARFEAPEKLTLAQINVNILAQYHDITRDPGGGGVVQLTPLFFSPQELEEPTLSSAHINNALTCEKEKMSQCPNHSVIIPIL